MLMSGFASGVVSDLNRPEIREIFADSGKNLVILGEQRRPVGNCDVS